MGGMCGNCDLTRPAGAPLPSPLPIGGEGGPPSLVEDDLCVAKRGQNNTQNMGGPPATGGEGGSGGELAGASFLFGYFLWTSKENSHAAAGSR